MKQAEVMRKLLFLLLVTASLAGNAQKPFVSFTLEGIGDNREFHNGRSRAQTMLGSLGNLTAGASLDNHSLVAGVSHLLEFGTSIDFHVPKLILYYQFDDGARMFRFGAFPRRGTVSFPLAMLADTLLMYRPLVEGLFGKIEGEWGFQMAFTDWTGRQTETVREAFMAGTSGEVKIKKWFFQNFILLDHLAHTYPSTFGQHIHDHFGFSLMAGVRSNPQRPLSGEIKAGLLSSLFRERTVTDGFIAGHSLLISGEGRLRSLGLNTTLKIGDPIRFAHGDPFYRFENYLRTDAMWFFINHKNVKGRFNWSLHWVDFEMLDHSQQMTIICSF